MNIDFFKYFEEIATDRDEVFLAIYYDNYYKNIIFYALSNIFDESNPFNIYIDRVYYTLDELPLDHQRFFNNLVQDFYYISDKIIQRPIIIKNDKYNLLCEKSDTILVLNKNNELELLYGINYIPDYTDGNFKIIENL